MKEGYPMAYNPTPVPTAKITKHINFNLNVNFIYVDDTKKVNKERGPVPHFLQLMGIGFADDFKN